MGNPMETRTPPCDDNPLPRFLTKAQVLMCAGMNVSNQPSKHYNRSRSGHPAGSSMDCSVRQLSTLVLLSQKVGIGY
jgi:hypothetical protein